MAQDIGMFGMSVDDVGRQQDAEYMNLIRGASTADKAGLIATRGFRDIGSALGFEDPRTQKAKIIEKVKQEVRETTEPGDIVAYYKAIAKAFHKYGLVEEAVRAEQAAQAMENKKLDSETKREDLKSKIWTREELARLKGSGKPFAVQAAEYAKNGKYSPESVAKYADSGNLADLKMYDQQANWKVKQERVTMNGKEVLLLNTYDENNKLRDSKRLSGDSINASASATGGSSSGPDPKELKDWNKVRSDFISEVKPYDDLMDRAEAAMLALKEAGTNPAQAQAALNQIARAFRVDAQNAKSEIEKMVNAGSLPGRLGSTLSEFFTGTLTQTKINNFMKALQGTQNFAKSKRETIQNQYLKFHSDLPQRYKDFIISGVNSGVISEDGDNKKTGVLTPEEKAEVDAILGKK